LAADPTFADLKLGGLTHPSANCPIRLVYRPSGPLGCGRFQTCGFTTGRGCISPPGLKPMTIYARSKIYQSEARSADVTFSLRLSVERTQL